MTPSPEILAIRFGTGRSPRFPDPADAPTVLAELSTPDVLTERFSIPRTDSMSEEFLENDRLRAEGALSDSHPRRKALVTAWRARAIRNLGMTVARALEAKVGFRERLVWFWADHFTTVGRYASTRPLVSAHIDEAIRPHVTGRFADMLLAAETHPAMLLYLEQSGSVGPNSEYARQRGKGGLNENLAREMLELHTIGVEGSYTQDDVRQLAELLAGLRVTREYRFDYCPERGEPGTKSVLGRSYGAGRPAIADIHAVIEDLAAHPETARHIARKLAVHFVADEPDPDLVGSLAARFRETGGMLGPVYEVLLTHPAALSAPLTKVKQPLEYMVSSLRALGVRGRQVGKLRRKGLRVHLHEPLKVMGQPWQRSSGPNGWPEEAGCWITPQALAARIHWALSLDTVPGLEMPDPRALVRHSLGPLASEALVVAANDAETRREGIGIVLASSEFQRR